MQSVTMQHISSKDIPAEDFHPPSVCALPLKAVSSFSSVSSSSHISGFLIPSCLRGVGGVWKMNIRFLPDAVLLAFILTAEAPL